MSKLTQLKQQGPCLAVFFYALFFNCVGCYSDTIIPKLDGSTGTHEGWAFNNLADNSLNGYWLMNNTLNSSVETIQSYDLSTYTSISITAKIGTYTDFEYCTTKLEISDDGINWTLLKENSFSAKKTDGINFSYSAPSLLYTHAKIRLTATNSNSESGARLFTIEIKGTPKFIPIPITNDATEITTNSFIAHWNACDNATNYEIYIYNKLPGKVEKSILKEDFRELNTTSDECFDSQLSKYLPKWNGKNIYYYLRTSENKKFLKIGNSTEKGYIETPSIDLSNNNSLFELSFDIGTSNNNACSVYLYLNNNIVDTIYVNGTNDLPIQHMIYSFSSGNTNNKIKLEGVTKKNGSFLLDNITITQLLDGVETAISGYPTVLDNVTSYTVEGLAPNSTYYYTIKATNGNITTNKSDEICVKTLSGEQMIINANEERVFNNEIINGDLLINDGAKVSGKVTVNGEISYACKFTPDKWHSFSLPFIPCNVGGYINGSAYSLRANYDYMLQKYQNEHFENTSLENDGYIIKVLSKIDNGELFFFSNKGTTLNENTNQYIVNDGYTHLGNPYTYSINPKALVDADKYYLLENNKFIQSENELLPFQSFIIYKGTKTNQALRTINIETESTNIASLESDNIRIRQNGGSLQITGIEIPVSVYSAQGQLMYAGLIAKEKSIFLSPGLYLIKIKNKTTKIVIK